LQKQSIAIIVSILALSSPLSAKKDEPFKPLTPLEAVKRFVPNRVAENEARIESIVAETFAQAKEKPLFIGPKAVEATVALQLGIAIWESGLKLTVEDCTDRGDHGRAYGLPQIHAEHFSEKCTKIAYNRSECDAIKVEICQYRYLQWKIQNQVLQQAKRYCKSMNSPDYEDKGPVAWTANYHTGDKECKPTPTSYGHITYFSKLLKNMGIRIYKNGKNWAAR
jgi:hypothetical protein